MWTIFKKSLLIVPILSLFYVLGLLASEAGGILFPKRTEGLGWEANKHFTIFIVLLGLCILCIYWSLNKKLLFFKRSHPLTVYFLKGEGIVNLGTLT